MKESWPCAEMKILASSDEGILCCERHIRKGDYRYYACKPATKQWQALPNPKLRYQTDAVAIVVVQHHPLRYLIVRLSYSTFGEHYNCEIFDSKIWAWERVECTISSGDRIYPAGVTIGQSVHWRTNNDNVLTLDITKRCFQCFSLPEKVRCDDAYECKQLVAYEGMLLLGLRCKVGDWIELWVVERQRQGEWTRRVAVDMMDVEKTLSRPQLVEFCNTDVAFIKTDDEAVFYNHQNRSFSRAEVPWDLQYPTQIFRFQSDFESVELKGG